MAFNDIQIIILFSSIVLFTTLGVVVALFIIFQRKKLAFILKQQEQEKAFHETLLKSQIEIKERTLKNVAWELHDNIGQLLSLAKMELNVLSVNHPNQKEDLDEVNDLVGTSLNEIRSISKILNTDVIQASSLRKSIKTEVERLNRLKFIDTGFSLMGEYFDIATKDRIILFRIVQEILTNTIKHSKATKLDIKMNYSDDKLVVSFKDNGVGFDKKKIEQGSGLINMKKRAELIQAKLHIDSDENGTLVQLEYPKDRNKIY